MPRPSRFYLVLLLLVILLFAAILATLIGWVLPALTAAPPPAASPSPLPTAPEATASPTRLSSAAAPSPAPPTATLPPATALEGLRRQGVMILSMSDGANFHLFAYHPQFLPLTRLTNNPWDDIQPAISPDGARLAFASRQNGYWDLYLLDLVTGLQTRVTDSPEYDGAPVWSPDGQWLAYESYTAAGIQIFLRQLSKPADPPVQFTAAPGQAFAPAWSPGGREIAFVSTRSGQEDIWLGRLDRIDDRFVNVSPKGGGRDHTPRWSPDGLLLAWAADAGGSTQVLTWDTRAPEQAPLLRGTGSRPVWGPSGANLLAEVREPNATSLAVIRLADASLEVPPLRLPGTLNGADWRAGFAPEAVVQFPFPANSRGPAAPLFTPQKTVSGGLQKNRAALVPLKDLAAPQPYLLDVADESYQALRKRVAQDTGWDFLATLESAYLPITTPSLPDLLENWLYTGRGIAINSAPLSAGWLALVREEIGGQAFWRVYLRCLYQDASMGLPLAQRPWDLNARYRGDPRVYDQGGEYGPVTEGYWVDFTELAARYGWERLPALINWRTYYPATRFNAFVYREGLTYAAAMDQVYPPEALVFPTPWVTSSPTVTLTPTLWYQRLITPSLTATITPTPTRRPTLTPAPVQ